MRVSFRANAFYLVPLAILIGVMTSAMVTAISALSQIAHVWLYGIPLDVHLSAHARIQPLSTLLTLAAGGLLLGLMEWYWRRRKISNAIDPVEANTLPHVAAVQRIRRVHRPGRVGERIQ